MIITASGLRTRVLVSGDGPVLLLLNGIWQTVDDWDRLLSSLHGFTVVRFDPPGIGGTQSSWWPYELRWVADHVVAVMDALGVSRAHVLGFSYGGAVAQQLAHDHPSRVGAVVLASTSHTFPGSVFASVLRAWHPVRYFSDAGRLAIVCELLGGKVGGDLELLRCCSEDPDHVEPDHVGWAMGMPVRVGALWRMMALAQWTSRPWLHTVTAPTLVVHGDDDHLISHRDGIRIADWLPNAGLAIVHGAGHLALLEDVDAIGPRINAFLRDENPPNLITNVRGVKPRDTTMVD